MIKDRRKVLETIVNPFQRFLQIEAAGGIVLLLFTIIALFWANSRWGLNYTHFWELHLTIGVEDFALSKSLLHWINDGLMAIFFFVVGLEIKRELVVGELSSFKKASLPITAAIGGMLLPAIIFIIVNKDTQTETGWGIPMATDIAFSLGVLSLLGKRVPLSIKVFLVAFAVIDDLGAVVVIALFYSGEMHWNYLLIALTLFFVLVLFNRADIRYIPAYMIIGWIIWFLFLKSGIHPTIAGVMIAFTVPLKRKLDVGTFRRRMDINLELFCPEDCSDEITLSGEQLDSIDNMEDELNRVQSPVQSLEHTLHHFVTFVVMPLFALTNAGVVFKAAEFNDIFTQLSGTIEQSLILGKVGGIFLFTWLSVKLGIGVLPENVRWVHILGLGFLGGMGFTMSLFIANLAFLNSRLLDPAKIGILVGSLIAGILGYIVLRMSLKKENSSE
ncbi:MAG: Na+/H+ antiporter NhaA [Bacteroidales bacterium]|nr:Na+/H+ antiporter NhaA [Bacteroidales bacterium]